MADPLASRRDERQPVVLSDLPRDELLSYGRLLGLDLDERSIRDDLVRQIRGRQELIVELDRGALSDIVVWSRRPIRPGATKEDLAREIALAENTNYENLSPRGLIALARLRDVAVLPTDDPARVIAEIRRREGFWKRLRRHRRKLTAAVVAKFVEQNGRRAPEVQPGTPDANAGTTKPDGASFKKEIQDYGLVSGLANRLRGVADDYIKIKLDEIETRIDAKLDQIDQRLSEWRDKEVANRLRILRITLLFTVLVALLSLGYNAFKTWVAHPTDAPVSKQGADR